MATHLNVYDLAWFLGSRKSTDCRMAADWAEEHPYHPEVMACVNRLEEYLVLLANSDEMRHVSLSTCFSQRTLWQAANIRRSSCLFLVAKRYDLAADNYECWPNLVRLATQKFYLKAPAWAAVLSRRLKLAHSPRPAEPEDDGLEEYVVEFLVVKRVAVRETDEIQAEWTAARQLTEQERRDVFKLRVLGPDGAPLTDSQVGPDDGFWRPDKKYW